MNDVKLSPFKFEKFSIIESSIKRKKRLNDNLDLKYKILPSGIIDEDNKTFELQLIVNIIDDNGQFESKVIIVGIFEFKEVTRIENLNNYFYVNAPAIIFPYVRAYIAALTSLSGFETINLPPINVGILKDELKGHIQIINSSNQHQTTPQTPLDL